ncbi:MAG: hypothetical protein ACTSQY_09460, partial [Candidatus Odinarchaeia archaeon]
SHPVILYGTRRDGNRQLMTLSIKCSGNGLKTVARHPMWRIHIENNFLRQFVSISVLLITFIFPSIHFANRRIALPHLCLHGFYGDLQIFLKKIIQRKNRGQT